LCLPSVYQTEEGRERRGGRGEARGGQEEGR